MSKKQEFLIKASRFCAFRERCPHEVFVKLKELGATKTIAETIVSELKLEGFINEERFSRMFAGGKFRQKKWGRRKIIKALQERKISNNCISLGLEEIGQEDYCNTLRGLISKKQEELEAKGVANITRKLADFCIRKGFEPNEVWSVLRSDKGRLGE